MIAVTVDEIATVLGAQLAGSGDPTAVVSALIADSRAVAAGALFVALPGEHADGHDYVAAAAAAGAAASLTRHPVPGSLCLVVVDPLVALDRRVATRTDIARNVRALAPRQCEDNDRETHGRETTARCSGAPIRAPAIASSSMAQAAASAWPPPSSPWRSVRR